MQEICTTIARVKLCKRKLLSRKESSQRRLRLRLAAAAPPTRSPTTSVRSISSPSFSPPEDPRASAPSPSPSFSSPEPLLTPAEEVEHAESEIRAVDPHIAQHTRDLQHKAANLRLQIIRQNYREESRLLRDTLRKLEQEGLSPAYLRSLPSPPSPDLSLDSVSGGSVTIFPPAFAHTKESRLTFYPEELTPKLVREIYSLSDLPQDTTPCVAYPALRRVQEKATLIKKLKQVINDL